jgi:TolA-binding protein
MNGSSRINYIFLLLSIGIVSTILSSPISGQTQNNTQNQTAGTAGSGPYATGKPGIGSAEELESITNDSQTRTSNDSAFFQQLGKETQTGNQTTGGQQQGNQTTGGQQQGNQSDNPLSNVGEAIGNLFK